MSFKFEMDSKVKIEMSGETGVIRGRAEYVIGENTYYIRYLANDGRAVSGWKDESEIVAV